MATCTKSNRTPWRQQALLRDYRKVTTNPNIPLHHDLLTPAITRLRSRKPPISTAKHLHENGFDIREQWKIGWLESSIVSPIFDFDSHTSTSHEFNLPRKTWCNLNRLRTGHGRCNEMLHKWNLTDNPSCECEEPHQTTDHILFDCPILSYQGNIEDLRNLHPDALQWLKNLKLWIWSNQLWYLIYLMWIAIYFLDLIHWRNSSAIWNVNNPYAK